MTGGLVTAFAAVAVARAIDDICEVVCNIKWVNDIFVSGRKLCGILTEGGGDIESGSLSYLVVGFGINTHKCALPPTLIDIATSIEGENGTPPSRPLLLARILDEFATIETELVTRQFMDEYRRRSNLLGREITVFHGNESYAAIAVDIDDNGALIVKVDGQLRTIISGEVSVRL